MTGTKRHATDFSQRKVALTAGLALLFWTLLASFADFGVLQSLVVPGDSTATVENINASGVLFRIAIAAFLSVTVLNVVVAWALYILLRPGHETLAVLVGWLRLAAAAIFAVALANLLDVGQLLGGVERSTLESEQLQAQVMASIASFDSGWAISLTMFGLHLFGLGYLLLHFAHVPRLLAVLVIVAGGGYLADSLAAILAPDFAFTPSVATFFGQAWLTFWLLWRAARGFPTQSVSADGQTDPPLTKPTPVAS